VTEIIWPTIKKSITARSAPTTMPTIPLNIRENLLSRDGRWAQGIGPAAGRHQGRRSI